MSLKYRIICGGDYSHINKSTNAPKTHLKANLNPIAQNTSRGGLSKMHFSRMLYMCKCLSKQHLRTKAPSRG